MDVSLLLLQSNSKLCLCPTEMLLPDKDLRPARSGRFSPKSKTRENIWVKTQGQEQAGSPKTIRRTTNIASA
jgi:hypothetical protein